MVVSSASSLAMVCLLCCYAFPPMGEHALQRPPSYRPETSETLWHLDRQILPIPPLLPRPNEVAQVRITEQAQRQVGVRGAVPTLSKGYDGVVRVHPRRGVHSPQRL